MSDTRDEIVKIALNLFLQKTYKEVSIQEIVDKVGMTKGAFYYFFKNKEQLFLEVVNQFAGITQVDFRQFNNDSLSAFYHDYIHHIIDSSDKTRSLSENTAEINSYFLTFDALRLFPEFRKRMYAYDQFELTSWMDVICTARKNGEIQSLLTDEQIAKVFIFTGDGIGMRSILQGKSNEMGKAILALWDGIYASLQA